jgi:glucokinase
MPSKNRAFFLHVLLLGCCQAWLYATKTNMKTNGILIGVDLGGTNVRVGAITPDGELLKFKNTLIDAQRGPEQGVQKISGMISAVSAEVDRPILGIGIGSAGPLDRERGCIQNPYTLPGWEDVDIVSPVAAQFGVPVALENDADAAALGESWAGAGRGLSRLAMITIGTGVGSGLVFNGDIYRGVNGYHPEGGHIIIDPAGPECYCGARGCWESLVSGPAIAGFARKAPALQDSSIHQACAGQPDRIDAAMIFKAAQSGDALACQLVEQTANYIVLGLVSVIMLYLPDCIVLTGGVLRSFGVIEDQIRESIKQHNVVVPAQDVQIRLSELGQQAGMFGAARAAQLLLMDTGS